MTFHTLEFVYLCSTVPVFSVQKRLRQGHDGNAYCRMCEQRASRQRLQRAACFLHLGPIRDHTFAFLDHVDVTVSSRDPNGCNHNEQPLMLKAASLHYPLLINSHNICTYTVCELAMPFDENQVVYLNDPYIIQS